MEPPAIVPSACGSSLIYAAGVDFGIDQSDPFGVGALFLAQSMAHRFDCEDQVRFLLRDLLELVTPRLPNEDSATAMRPIDELLDRVEAEPGSLELIEALLDLGTNTPPRTPVSEQLYRSVMWTAMRNDPAIRTPHLLEIVRAATPGARLQDREWPRHEFFSTVLVLVYLGGQGPRIELTELLEAARDLGYHDLAPVLEWYLDHDHDIPARAGG